MCPWVLSSVPYLSLARNPEVPTKDVNCSKRVQNGCKWKQILECNKDGLWCLLDKIWWRSWNWGNMSFKSVVLVNDGSLWLCGTSYIHFVLACQQRRHRKTQSLSLSLSLSLHVSMFVQSWTTQRPGLRRSMLWYIGCRRRTDRCWSCWWNIWLSRLKNINWLDFRRFCVCANCNSELALLLSSALLCLHPHRRNLPVVVVFVVHPWEGLGHTVISWPYAVMQYVLKIENHPTVNRLSLFPDSVLGKWSGAGISVNWLIWWFD